MIYGHSPLFVLHIGIEYELDASPACGHVDGVTCNIFFKGLFKGFGLQIMYNTCITYILVLLCNWSTFNMLILRVKLLLTLFCTGKDHQKIEFLYPQDNLAIHVQDNRDWP